ncbi:hypothetical protein [Streptomyces sp. NPDC048338]|uniref:hypothetical protein n=1 Tax=Streptomyces sp. NPDC048338 TaxID=3365536 RepID=UPI00371C4CF8
MVAALVAAAGLAVTAWGTLKSAQVADDQLTQSKERMAQEDRKVASRATTWQSGASLIIANRNLETTVVYVSLRQPPKGWPVVVRLGITPPCTRFEVPLKPIQDEVERLTREGSWGFSSLFVGEPSGRLWERRPEGGLRAIPVGVVLENTHITDVDPYVIGANIADRGKDVLASRAVKTEGLEECGISN